MLKSKQFWIRLLLVLGLLSLPGCAGLSPKPVSGVVVEKDYDKATSKYRNGKWKRTKADWDITVRDAQGKEHEVDVSEDVYNSIREGDKFSNGAN